MGARALMARAINHAHRRPTKAYVSGGVLPFHISPARRIWLMAEQRRLRADYLRRKAMR